MQIYIKYNKKNVLDQLNPAINQPNNVIEFTQSNTVIECTPQNTLLQKVHFYNVLHEKLISIIIKLKVKKTVK